MISAELAAARAELRGQAVKVEADHLAVLEVWDAGPGTIARPAPRVLHASGEYRDGEAADWDWFYRLSSAEQGRLRRNWFAQPGDSCAQSPDELGDRLDCSSSEAMALWVDETRIVDAARAMTTGRPVNPDLYGGFDIDSLFDSQYRATALYQSDLDEAEDHVTYVNGGLTYGCGVDPAEQYREAQRIEDDAHREAVRMRQEAIGRMLAAGMSVAEIAVTLGISRQAANEQARRVRGDRRNEKKSQAS